LPRLATWNINFVQCKLREGATKGWRTKKHKDQSLKAGADAVKKRQNRIESEAVGRRVKQSEVSQRTKRKSENPLQGGKTEHTIGQMSTVRKTVDQKNNGCGKERGIVLRKSDKKTLIQRTERRVITVWGSEISCQTCTGTRGRRILRFEKSTGRRIGDLVAQEPIPGQVWGTQSGCFGGNTGLRTSIESERIRKGMRYGKFRGKAKNSI